MPRRRSTGAFEPSTGCSTRAAAAGSSSTTRSSGPGAMSTRCERTWPTIRRRSRPCSVVRSSDSRPSIGFSSETASRTNMAHRIVGQPLGRLDGADKVSGAARYSADVTLPGLVWGKALRSPLPHARIVRIDTSKARALPGVLAVLTAKDLPDILVGRRMFDMPVLARDRVRFIGEKVAVVAALDPDLAEEALALIEVEYEDLPAVFDPVEAIRPDAPLVHENPGAYEGAPPERPHPNVQSVLRFKLGDVEA